MPSDSDYDCQLHLSFRDVKVDDHRDPHFIEVIIKASKTDPFRKGVSVFIGKTGGDLCPVAAILSYMVCPSVPFQRRPVSHKSSFRLGVEEYSGSDWCGPSGIRGAQFSYWGSHNGRPSGPPGLPDTNVGQVAELSL